MIEVKDMQYNATAEKVVDVIMQKTQNFSPLFFRILVAYNLCKVASMMRCKIATHDRGEIPINMYAINLALSGQGKGHSTNIIEEEMTQEFKDMFLQDTFNEVAMDHLRRVANKRSIRKASDPDDEYERALREFDSLGELAFSFDSATPAAIKQLRQKLLLANAGSMNLEIDEIGSNLISNTDALTTYLELYDVGKIKQKLTKNTVDNTRGEEIDGRTPANAMLFGTPSKLFDGGKTESEFVSFLDTGYARRCFFGYQVGSKSKKDLTPEEVYDQLTTTNSSDVLNRVASDLADLADIGHYNMTLSMSKETSIISLTYKQNCERIADTLEDHEEIRKSELSHRYFKAMKLAGAYAFIDGSSELTADHLYAAIKLAEDSGEAFGMMLTRDKTYVKLAKYLAQTNHEMTHVDLIEDLPFYKGSESHRRQLLDLATAWGIKNHIVIKRSLTDGIEFLQGESMKEATLDSMRIAYSKDMARDYIPDEVPFADLHKVTQAPGYNFVNHFLQNNHRREENVIKGCDYIVLDIDEGKHLEKAKLLLRDYTYHIYTTKSHTAEVNRFRLIMPLSHRVTMEATEFKEFMTNIYSWLPFPVDEAAKDRVRKWASNPGTYFNNEGKSLDAMMFIPKTSKCDRYKETVINLGNLSNLERWFVKETAEGNRSNNLIKYALMQVDSGYDVDTILNNVKALNDKLSEPIPEQEIYATIMQTVSRKIADKNKA